MLKVFARERKGSQRLEKVQVLGNFWLTKDLGTINHQGNKVFDHSKTNEHHRADKVFYHLTEGIKLK